jgi:hypothetical protein
MMRLGQNQKSINTKKLNHGPRDVIDDHMGAQLAKLNEVINEILRFKRVSKMFKKSCQMEE